MKTPDQTLAGKQILFISPKFFGYEEKITAKMRDMGAIVRYYDERSVRKASSRSLLKISPKIFYRQTREYYEQILQENQQADFNYIFIVKAEMIPEQILEKFRETFRSARFCLYLWDSISNIKGVEKKFKYFDRILTFDVQDAQLTELLEFRPLFYIDDYSHPETIEQQEFKYDLSFLGTIHSDRYRVIRTVRTISQAKSWKTFFFCYLQSPFIYYFYKLIKPEFRATSLEEFSFVKMESKAMAEVVRESKTILDINHPKQTGLTMRTIEMIGMNKKLITTNENIKEYDFYNSNNILIIDRNNVEIPDEFISQHYEPIAKGIYSKYSLEAWIKEILLNEQVSAK